jgi:DNA-directed RNA polymerase specialized sigma24 family protein
MRCQPTQPCAPTPASTADEQARLYFWARKTAHVLGADPDSALDLASDAWAKLLSLLAGGARPDHPCGWLRNEMSKALRTDSRRQARRVSLAETKAVRGMDDDGSDGRSLAAVVDAAGLPPRRREILLAYGRTGSYLATAELLGCSKQYVALQIKSGIRDVRRHEGVCGAESARKRPAAY